MKVIFMGTPEFSVPTLQAIFDSSHKVVQVYTKPPSKSGRGHNINISPVHNLANILNIPVAHPNTLKDEKVIESLASLKADIIVVAAYGHILPKAVLELCPYGCINVHPSLLPRWRGAAPIERTVLAGDSETGVCIMKMDSGLDTGDILLTERVSIDNHITTVELYKKLAAIGALLTVKVLDNYQNIIPKPQSENGITYAKKLSKEESIINWQQSANEIDRMIRALNPWPGCFFRYQGELVKILEARVISETSCNSSSGTIINDKLHIQCKQGILQPLKLQKPGRNILELLDFLRGNKIEAGTILE
jgi:methionyl-tRNA formyltransferase